MERKSNFITKSALVATFYVVLTLFSNLLGLASGVIQVRISEVLTVLPAFMPASVPGLFVGCLISNLLCGNMMVDVILGSVATLLGAIGTYYFGKSRWTAPIFPIISNTIIIPFVLRYVYGLNGAIWFFALTVFAGEFISCGIIGTIFFEKLKKILN